MKKMTLKQKAKLCKKMDYYYIMKNPQYFNANDYQKVIKGHYHFINPFGPCDDLGYTINGYAHGWKWLKERIKDGDLKKITKTQAANILLNNLR